MTIERINSYNVFLSEEERTALKTARSIIAKIADEIDNRGCDYALCSGSYEKEVMGIIDLVDVESGIELLENIERIE